MDRGKIVDTVLGAISSANLGRPDDQQLEISATAPLFGGHSPLDSLGLVALLIDVEEAFANIGQPIVLSDERALSQRRSPFRDVPSLVEYIQSLLDQQPA